MSKVEEKFSLDDAQRHFVDMMKRFRSDKERRDFLLWVELEFKENSSRRPGFAEELSCVHKPEVDERLQDVVLELRKRVPQFSVFPSEKFVVPQGDNSDCCPEQTVHVDAFLYNDDDVDALVDAGQLQRNYCLDCNSKSTAPLNFISHSMSRERLDFIFNFMLAPDFVKKSPLSKSDVCPCLLDVGSRLGGTLFAAYLHTDIPKIKGIELNKDFCNLQEDICKKFKMDDRVSIIEDDLLNQADLVKEASLIILNNPFEFFCEKEEQRKLWLFLKNNISRGSILVCVPPLENTFGNLEMEAELKNWVTAMDPYNTSAADDEEELSETQMYKVL